MMTAITDREFARVVEQSAGLVLVEFWQPGCKHCQALRKELALVQEEYGDGLSVFTMNVQENFLIPAELDIHSLPALALYVEGRFQKFIGGIGRKNDILSHLAAAQDPHSPGAGIE